MEIQTETLPGVLVWLLLSPIFSMFMPTKTLESAEKGPYQIMKAGIHPEYKKATVTCICGSVFETRSTIGDLKLKICSNCHPFFTGRQKLVDTEVGAQTVFDDRCSGDGGD